MDLPDPDQVSRSALLEKIRQQEAEIERYRHHLGEMIDERTADLLATQQELEASRSIAEAANHAKSAFLANMSHEIRTPMNAVIALSHLMLQDIGDPKQRDRLLKIANSAQHLLALINDILDFSKIEAGKLKLENIDFDLDKVLKTVSNQIEDRIASKGLRWVIERDAAIPDMLYGDSLRLGQVLLNYAGNAIKFTKTGEVRLIVECLAQDKAGQRIRFVMKDTGCGFDPNRKEQLFLPFEQANPSTTREYGGTGLGLAICRRIADMMGGQVGAEGQPGWGSTFWFEAYFPNASRAQVAVSLRDLAHCRAVVLGKDRAEAMIFHKLLEELGVRVQSVYGPREAATRIEVAARAGHPYDFLFFHGLDAALEARYKKELATRLDAANLDRLPASILISQSASRSHAAGLTFDAVLELPVTLSSLRNLLQSLLEISQEGKPQTSDVIDKPSDLAERAHLRILLVEDNPINQDVGLDILASAGLSADIADNGREAIALAEARQYDLILMDMQMPVMDGIEATGAIRRMSNYRDVPILALTANAFDDDRQRCIEAGMNDHIAKPVIPDNLYAALRRWLPDRPRLVDAIQAVAAVSPAPTSGSASQVDLPEMAGLDIAAGLMNVNGKRDRYRGLLDRLVREHGDDPVLIRAAFAAGQLDEARRMAHSLKGAAALLGAVEIRSVAHTLEFMFKNGEIDASKFSNDLGELDRALRNLAQGLVS